MVTSNVFLLRYGNHNMNLFCALSRWLLVTILTVSSVNAFADNRGMIAVDRLKAHIEELFSQSGGEVGVAVEHLETGSTFSINGNKSDWENLTSSLKFAGLGNNIIFEILTSDNKYKTIEIESDNIKELAR